LSIDKRGERREGGREGGREGRREDLFAQFLPSTPPAKGVEGREGRREGGRKGGLHFYTDLSW